jgi:hypothetical protein
MPGGGLVPIPVPAATDAAQQFEAGWTAVLTPNLAFSPVSAAPAVCAIVAPSAIANEPGTLEDAATTCQPATPLASPVKTNCDRLFCLTASPRASCIAASSDSAVDLTWLLLIQAEKLGMPSPSTIARIAMDTSNSTMENPR